MQLETKRTKTFTLSHYLKGSFWHNRRLHRADLSTFPCSSHLSVNSLIPLTLSPHLFFCVHLLPPPVTVLCETVCKFTWFWDMAVRLQFALLYRVRRAVCVQMAWLVLLRWSFWKEAWLVPWKTIIASRTVTRLRFVESSNAVQFTLLQFTQWMGVWLWWI